MIPISTYYVIITISIKSIHHNPKIYQDIPFESHLNPMRSHVNSIEPSFSYSFPVVFPCEFHETIMFFLPSFTHRIHQRWPSAMVDVSAVARARRVGLHWLSVSRRRRGAVYHYLVGGDWTIYGQYMVNTW